jgi:hypothetical protein
LELTDRDYDVLKLTHVFSQVASTHVTELLFAERSHSVPDKVLGRLVRLGYLSRVGRRATGSKGGAGAFPFAASVGSQGAAADLVDDLVTKAVLHRGYILKCERCSLSSWYSLGVLSSVFTCNRCSFQQQFTQKHWKNGMAEPRWCYKLAETVYQFYYTNSHLTAQVLYKLKSQSATAFHYAPEVDLINFSGPGENREMDVACILDGQIVFGECKTEKLKPKDVEKFEALAAMPIKNPARIVFATTQPVSEDFKKRMSRLPNAELMVRSDLYDD